MVCWPGQLAGRQTGVRERRLGLELVCGDLEDFRSCRALQMVAEIDTYGGQPVDLKTAVAPCHQD